MQKIRTWMSILPLVAASSLIAASEAAAQSGPRRTVRAQYEFPSTSSPGYVAAGVLVEYRFIVCFNDIYLSWGIVPGQVSAAES